MEQNLTEFFGAASGAEPPEFARLVKRAQSGEQQAFDALLARFQDMAVGYCGAILGDFQLAEDAAQEAFLETYRVLPAIRVAEAFPAYLRLTLRKHCNRLTRRKQIATIPLNAAFELTDALDLPSMVEAHERESEVRVAVRSLPQLERESVLLFYIGQRSLKEVATFLDVPISTVKNRLHAARCKLRERLLDSMETSIQRDIRDQRPSKDEKFRGQIIVRLYETFEEQFRADRQTADRDLLTQARAELREAIKAGALDAETVRAAVRLLTGTDEYGALPEIMENYLSQPLPLAEEFWAKWTRIRGLAFRRETAAVIEAQRELMNFVKTRLPGNPPVRLSAREPFAPTDDSNETAIATDALPVFALGIVEVGLCFRDGGALNEWFAFVHEATNAAPKTTTNRLWRFFKLRHAIHVLGIDSGQDKIDTLIESMRALADEEADWQAPRWQIEALYMRMRLLGETKDTAMLSEVGVEAVALLDSFQASIDSEIAEQRGVLRTLTNNLAAALTTPGTYDLALPIWERIAANIPANEWSYLCYAQCVWATTGDRERTLALLRTAASCSFNGDLPKSFAEHAPAFSAVREDVEFLSALIPPSGVTPTTP